MSTAQVEYVWVFELCAEPHSNQFTVLEPEVCTEITLQSSSVPKGKATNPELMNRIDTK